MARAVKLTTAALVALAVVVSGSAARASTFGICAHIPAERIQDEIVAAGIGWVRIDVAWALVELQRDTYSWELYDELIDTLQARGLRIYATISATPQWATSGSEFSGVPNDPADWKEFCYIVAARYRGRVDAWGFWNEPNLEHFWEGSRSEYVDEILLPGIEAVSSADPDALLAGPDLAHLTSASWDDWLERVIDDAGPYLDVIAHHVYPSNGTSGDVTDKLATSPTFPWEPPSLRDVLDGSGWGSRPFWLTETGVESDLYTEAGQAQFYFGMLDRWFGPDRDHDWMDRIFFYEMADPRSDPTLSWGILEEPPGLERKLAFYEYQDLISTELVDDAEISAQGLPPFVGSSQSLEPVFAVRNTGTSDWSSADGVRLELAVDEIGWRITVDPIPDGVTVGPGESVSIPASIRTAYTPPTAPPRQVGLDARMVRGTTDAFGMGPRHLFIITGREVASIDQEPVPTSAPYNGSATFSVHVAAPAVVSYQWRRNTVSLADDHRHSGTRTAELTVSGIGFDSLGDYDCVITSSAGSVASAVAALGLAGSPVRHLGHRLATGLGALVNRWTRFRAERPLPPDSGPAPTRRPATDPRRRPDPR